MIRRGKNNGDGVIAERRDRCGRSPFRVASSVICGAFYLLCIMLSVPAVAHEDRPAALRDVAFDQRLNAQVPLDLIFRDAAGERVTLSEYFGRKPVILTLVYYKCRDLCPLVLDGLVRALRALSFSVGDEFDIVTVSFDPHDDKASASAIKNEFVRRYGHAGAADGWHFLTGTEGSIQRLLDSVGFRTTVDEAKDRFAHATGILLLTPEGRISRVYYGIEFSPRDLRLGLVEASDNKIGSPIDQLLLFCYHYDPTTGQYNLLITNVIRLAGGGTVLVLAGFIFAMLRRDRSPASRNGGST